MQEAIETCRAGLVHHADYVSARVTLGRALTEAGELDEAQAELEAVLAAAPENLIAVRGLADIHHRRGQTGEALDLYRRALALAPNDADLEETVARLDADLREPVREPAPGPEPPPAEPGSPVHEPGAEPEPPPLALESFFHPPIAEPEPAGQGASFDAPVPELEASAADLAPPFAPTVSQPGPEPVPAEVVTAVPASTQSPQAEDARAASQIEALERWLDAILAERERQA